MCKASRYNKTSIPQGIFIMIPSLEGWPTKAKEAPSPHEVKLILLDTNPVFQCLGEVKIKIKVIYFKISLKLLEICNKHIFVWV